MLIDFGTILDSFWRKNREKAMPEKLRHFNRFVDRFFLFFDDFGSPGPPENHTFSLPGASGDPPGSLRRSIAELDVVFDRFCCQCSSILIDV